MKRTPLAKITRPTLSGIFDRDRLFRILDQARQKPVVWVAAQAGSGKTTLVASYLDSRKLPCLWYQVDPGDGNLASFFYYMGMAVKQAAPRYKNPLPLLTPEYLLTVPVFTRRYFEELFRRLKPPFVIVLDNYQDVPAESGFHDMLVHALDTVPDGITVIVQSRVDPPVPLARLQANNRLQLIRGDAVLFSREESGELLKMQGQEHLTREAMNMLYQRTKGWAAGLVLLMAAGRMEQDAFASDPVGSASLFDYFASEIFGKAGEAAQNVLVRTSFLTRIDTADAEQLTENEMAGQILEQLSRDHFFTEKYGRDYQYHPLFREFLRSQAGRTFTPAEVASIQRTAAGLLERSRRFEEAIALFIESRDWSGVERVLLGRAAELVSQGRGETLTAWIHALPVEHQNSNPWLIYWLGVCSLPFDPAKSRRFSEQSFASFNEQKNETGAFLAWAAAIQAAFHEWDGFDKIDPLIHWMDRRMESHAAFPSPEIEALVATGMTGALLWRRRSHAEYRKWTDRALTLTQAAGNNDLRLLAGINAVQFFILSGDYARGRMAGEDLARAAQAHGISPLLKLLCKAIDGFAQIMTMSSEEPLMLVRSCLEAAEKSGIPVWDHMLCAQGVYVSLNSGEMASAAEFLGKMKASLLGPKSFGLFHYHLLSGWYRLLNNEISAAQAHGENALRYILDSKAFHPEALFNVHYELAQIFHEQGDYEKASDHMARVDELVRTSGSSILEYMYQLSLAQFAFDRGEHPKGSESLRKAMFLGRQKNYSSMFWWWRPAVMSRLCAKALEQEIEPDYVRALILKRGLVPQGPVENWPWPLRIRTLGRFEVLQNEMPLTFPGKVQKKPLELLKALISFGGTDVSEELFHEALWPDADGDSAHRSFESALYRLRKLLGDKVLRLQDGLLTLDRRYCQVDCGEFQRLAEDALKVSDQRAARGTGDPSRERAHEIPPVEIEGCFEKALAIYGGPFLPNEMNQPWSLSLRERLATEYINLVTAVGRWRENAGQWERAIACYRKGLEAEELAEEFYGHLMRCHSELGQSVQVETVYRRCRAVLYRALGLAPSQRTEELYRALRAKK